MSNPSNIEIISERSAQPLATLLRDKTDLPRRDRAPAKRHLVRGK